MPFNVITLWKSEMNSKPSINYKSIRILYTITYILSQMNSAFFTTRCIISINTLSTFQFTGPQYMLTYFN